MSRRPPLSERILGRRRGMHAAGVAGAGSSRESEDDVAVELRDSAGATYRCEAESCELRGVAEGQVQVRVTGTFQPSESHMSGEASLNVRERITRSGVHVALPMFLLGLGVGGARVAIMLALDSSVDVRQVVVGTAAGSLVLR